MVPGGQSTLASPGVFPCLRINDCLGSIYREIDQVTRALSIVTDSDRFSNEFKD